MTNNDDKRHRSNRQRIARRAMLDRGLLPDFSAQAMTELSGIKRAVTNVEESRRDLRDLPWCSIDNDDSRDLDQLSVAETMPEGAVKVLIAIADVESVV